MTLLTVQRIALFLFMSRTYHKNKYYPSISVSVICQLLEKHKFPNVLRDAGISWNSGSLNSGEVTPISYFGSPHFPQVLNLSFLTWNRFWSFLRSRFPSHHIYTPVTFTGDWDWPLKMSWNCSLVSQAIRWYWKCPQITRLSKMERLTFMLENSKSCLLSINCLL